MVKKKTILVVDDEPDILEILGAKFSSLGYQCLKRSCGATALDLLNTEQVDLILSDLSMPHMDGVELLTAVSSRYPGTIRMLFSGIGEKEEIIQAVNQGHIHAYFTKPLDFGEVSQSIYKSFTERDRAERKSKRKDKAIQLALEERNEARGLFEVLVDTAADAIIIMDERGRIAYWNRHAERLFGYGSEAAIGKDLHGLLAAEGFGYKDRIIKGMNRFRLTGSGPLIGQTAIEVMAKDKAGITFPVELSLNSVKINKRWHAMGIVRDIRERKDTLARADSYKDKLQNALTKTVQAIGVTVEKRDPYTAGHQYDVAKLAIAIASEMGVKKERIEGIKLGATIHDIGKIYIPAEILNRPGKLTTAEFEMIKSHSEVGFDIVKDIDFPWPVREMIRQHHERLDGSGYPDGLKGDEIILEAQILAVADVVEAITSHRPYRPALGVEAGLNEIQDHKGDFFNAEAVDACVEIFQNKGFQFCHTND